MQWYTGFGNYFNCSNTNGVYNSTNKYIEYSTPSFSTMFMRASGGAPLPIDLLDFKGYNNGSVNEISWNVASTKDKIKYFDVQRSGDGDKFESLGSVAFGPGAAYNFTDRNPLSGANIYRLMLVDNNDGNYYSSYITVNSNEKNNWNVKFFPNPVKNQLQFSITGNMDQNATIHVFDLAGKQIKQINVTSNFETIDISGLPAGTYIVKYMDNSHYYIAKITKN